MQNKKCWSSINSDQRDLIHPTHLLLYTKLRFFKDVFSLFGQRKRDIFMKNTEKNKNKWIEKVRYTLELGGKSEKTFHNYKSHINRFLNSFSENVEINKLSEDKITDYFIKNYIQKNKCATTLNVGIASVRFLYSVCFQQKLNKDVLPSSKITKKIPTIISINLLYFVNIIFIFKRFEFFTFPLHLFCQKLATIFLWHI